MATIRTFLISVLLFLFLVSCGGTQSASIPPTPLPIRAAWKVQYDFISAQVERIDKEAVIRRFFAEPEEPFQLEPVRLAAQFERPTGGWIEISFVETRPYETTSVSEVPADIEVDMFPLARLPLLTETEHQSRRDIWEQIVVGPTEAVQRTAPLTRDYFLDSFTIEFIEFVFDERAQERFDKPAAWLVVYRNGDRIAIHWIDPTSGDVLSSQYGAEGEIAPDNYLPYPQL